MNLNFPLTDPFACFIYKLNIPTIISQLTAKLYRLTNFAYIKFVRKRLLERSKFRVRTFEAEVTVILVKTVSVSFVCAADRGCKFRSHRHIDAANERRKWASGASFIPLQKKKKKKTMQRKIFGKISEDNSLKMERVTAGSFPRCRKLFEEKVYSSPRCISSYNLMIFFQVQRRKCNGDYYFFFDVIVHLVSRDKSPLSYSKESSFNLGKTKING